MANMNLATDSKLITNSKPVRQSFGIADMSIVINLLTRLYSNPIRTLTQEYISNGRDANRETNTNKKLEITVPTRFNPLMIIRDFGPGLSPERIETVFLLYGASTKRTSNHQTGGFGIGAKSAWAYTDSFNIITYVDGIKRTYIAHKSSGNGNLDLISSEETKEHNGTEIQISVSPNDTQKFRNAVLRTIYFWNEKEYPILKGIDSSEIPKRKISFKLDNLECYEDLPSCFDNEYKDSYIIIDGIPYPNRDFTNELNRINKKKYAIHIPNSKVNIAPNREELIDDDITKSYLSNVDKTLQHKVDSYIKDKIDDKNDIDSALREGIELFKLFEFDFLYKIYRISYNQLSVVSKDSTTGKLIYETLGVRYEYRRGGKLYKTDNINNIHINDIDKIYYNDLPNEPATKIAWRIRKILDKQRNVHLLRNDLNKTVINDLKPILLSSIDASDYKVYREQKASTKKLEMCLHYYEGSKLDSTQVKLSDITDTVVYDIYQDSKTYKCRDSKEYNQWIKFIYEKGMSFAFIAKSSEHMISNNKKFIKYDTFVSNYKPTKEEIEKKIYNKLTSRYDNPYFSSFYYLDRFRSILDQINNKKFVYFLKKRIEKQADCATIPDKVFDNLKQNRIVREYTKNLEFLKTFENTFALIVDIQSERLTKQNVQKEVVNYINSKV